MKKLTHCLMVLFFLPLAVNTLSAQAIQKEKKAETPANVVKEGETTKVIQTQKNAIIQNEIDAEIELARVQAELEAQLLEDDAARLSEELERAHKAAEQSIKSTDSEVHQTRNEKKIKSTKAKKKSGN